MLQRGEVFYSEIEEIPRLHPLERDRIRFYIDRTLLRGLVVLVFSWHRPPLCHWRP
jgi:hypothetical protein